jgi:DNA polymerase III subunit beta
MNFSISKSALLKELNLVQGVVERKNTIPILSHLLLESVDGGISIKGTDLDVSISTQCAAEVKEEGAICLQAKKLFEIVRSLPEAEIEFKVGEQDHVAITCLKSRFKLVGLGKDNFPEIKSFDEPMVPLPASLLATFITRTAFAITNEESRYALNGAKFEISDDNVRMIATDGHRLSFIQKVDKFYEGEKIDVLVPRKTLTELARLSAESDGTVHFGKDENHLYFKVGKRLLASRTLSGQFPNYEMVLPKGNDQRAKTDAGLVSGAIRRVALMADERSHSVKLEVSANVMKISSQAADVGESHDEIVVDYSGPDITAGFNAQYLLDFFGVIQDGEVWFEFKDGNSQVQLKSGTENEYDFRYIVMPMRL